MPFWIEIRNHRVRFIKTLALYSCYLSIGLSLGIVGPTLLDLRQQVQTGLQQISFALTARAGGYAIGSLAMGLIYSKLNFQLATVFMMASSGFLTFSIPYLTSVALLLSIFVFNGVSLGFFEAGSNIFLLQLWGKENQPFMQALHLMYGLGALVAPLIAESFLVETGDVGTFKLNDSNVEVFHPEDVHLTVPYFMVATHLMFNAVIFFVLWRLHPETEPHPSKTQRMAANISLPKITSASGAQSDAKLSATDSAMISTAIDVNHHVYQKIVYVLVILFMHIYYGLEITFGSFLMTFAVKSKLHLSKADGAHLSSLFWSTFTFLRLFTVFYIEWVGAELNIFACLVVILIANGILVPYGNQNVSMLWTGVAMIGLGTSSIWSCMFGFLEEYFPVTNMIAAAMIVAAIVGEFVFPVIISSVINDMPEILLWVTLFCSTMISVLFTVIVLICRLKLEKPGNKQTDSAE